MHILCLILCAYVTSSHKFPCVSASHVALTLYVQTDVCFCSPGGEAGVLDVLHVEEYKPECFSLFLKTNEK